MGIFTKLGLGGRKAPGSTQARFMKVLDFNDLNGDITTDTDMPVVGTWYRVGTGYTVPAQQMMHVGYGSAELPDNQGYLYIQLTNVTGTPAPIVGKVRIVQANAQETVKFVVAEFNLAATRGSVTNKAMMIALPEQTQFPLVGEDSKIWLEVAGTVNTDEVDASVATAYIPVTIYM